MPYSITTNDGLQIDNIPDSVPHDDPSLKARVAALRSQRAPGSTPAAAPPPVTAPNTGYLMGLRDPFDGLSQMLEHALPDGVNVALNKSTNWLHDKLPSVFAQVEESPDGVSKLVQQINKSYTEGRTQRAQGLSNLVTGQQADPGFDWGRLAGNVINPVNFVPGAGAASKAETLGSVVAAGARAGGISALEQPVLDNDQNFWLSKAEQGVAGAATGAVATPLISKAAGAVANGVQKATAAVQSRLRAPVTPATVQSAANDVFTSQGMRLEEVPPVILQSVQRQAQEALASGQRLDPIGAVRRAEFEAVGLTGDAGPTLGQVMRDPMQYKTERNLMGVDIKTPQGTGNPLSDRFQNQANAMQHVFDRTGALAATDENAAGQTLMGALRTADQPVKAGVDQAYTTARAMNNGRAAELDRGHFSQTANQAIDEDMLGHALPADVRGLLNDITSGKTPFNVDAATQIDTLLSRAQRRVESGQQPDLSASMAIGKIRSALHATPLVEDAAPAANAAGGIEDAVITQGGAPRLPGPAVDRTLPVPSNGNQVGQVLPSVPGAPAVAELADNGANARAAFQQARTAARNRFSTIEDTPALKAALDDEAPDKFVRKYLLNADARDVAAMRTVLANSPEALGQARAQIAATLKRAAFGNNASGDGAFAPERYLNTLRSLGREKLSVFFTPEEIVQFNLAGKVMSDISSIPAGARGAVNTSGTAGALMNLLSRVSENPMMRKIPFARSVANHIGEVQTEQQMNKALAAQAVATNPAAELSPKALSAIRLLFAPSAVGIGAATGQAAQ